MSSIVGIVGRPNVGKSTLFNRLTEQRTAIVDHVSGVTRDRLYGECNWNGKFFNVIDTGGYVETPGDVFEEEIRRQVKIALSESDLLIFVLDVETGITNLDDTMAEILRKSEKPVIVAINKVDNVQRQNDVFEFYNLGLGEPIAISAITGSGTGELLDKTCENLPDTETKSSEEEDIPRFAIIGRPNAGKSSLINTIIGEERNLVTDIPGTTRDSVNTRFNKFGMDFILTDTAGLRRKEKVREDLEFYSVMRAVRAIEYSDICILMLDATRGIEAQDINILNLAKRKRKGLVIVVNKWDLVEKEKSSAVFFKDAIIKRTAPFTDVPIIFTSVITKQRIFKVLQTGIDVYKNRKQRISTSRLNKFLKEAIEAYTPPVYRGNYVKIKYMTQLPSKTPAFAFFCNFPEGVKENYKRYLENNLREKFDFTGVPLRLFFRKK